MIALKKISFFYLDNWLHIYLVFFLCNSVVLVHIVLFILRLGAILF